MTCWLCGRRDWLEWDRITCRLCGVDYEGDSTFTLESRSYSEDFSGFWEQAQTAAGRDLRQRP
jgi:hypothetical protein